ncbi:kinase-like domain-containing protein [Suillus spraguei]|nr:kinase-like domain-containing protein [Suillus spraguei]
MFPCCLSGLTDRMFTLVKFLAFDDRSSISQTSLVRTPEDYRCGCHLKLYEKANSQHEIKTPQISICGSCVIDPRNVIRQTSFPTASGGLGDVYKCTWNRSASPEEVLQTSILPVLVAVKSPRFPSLTEDEVAKINHSIDREIKIWTVLEHRYVLRLHGTVTGFGPFRALVSPWMPNGTLNSYLNRARKTLTTMSKLRILKQITEGLKYLHDNDVIHGDLTSNNILIAADGSPRLADFGVSNIMVESNPAFSYQIGAVRWAAPELIVREIGQTVQCATKSSDIYSLGCIMFHVLYGKLPYWWIKTALQVVASKYRHQEPVTQSINNIVQIPAHYLDFMRRCWSIKSEIRPSVEEVLDFLEGAISKAA